MKSNLVAVQAVEWQGLHGMEFVQVWCSGLWRKVYVSGGKGCPRSVFSLLASTVHAGRLEADKEGNLVRWAGQRRECSGFKGHQSWKCGFDCGSPSSARCSPNLLAWPLQFHSASVCVIPNSLTFLFPLSGMP